MVPLQGDVNDAHVQSTLINNLNQLLICKCAYVSNEFLKKYVFSFQRWKDEYLKWNITEFPDVDRLHLPVRSIWRPDINLYQK